MSVIAASEAAVISAGSTNARIDAIDRGQHDPHFNSNMNRRTVLTAVASSFGATAGCSGLFSSGTDTPTSEANSTAEKRTAVATVDGCPLPKETRIEQAICDGKQSDSEVFSLYPTGYGATADRDD